MNNIKNDIKPERKYFR